jgi:enoyl-CoA hydratase/carnithine racemase
VAAGSFFLTKRALGGTARAMFDLAIAEGIARLRLVRPEARNAIALDGWAELAAKVAEVEAAGARLLVLGGSREAFCAGADLGDFAGLAEDPAAVARFRLDMRAALDRLRDAPFVTVALVEGPCYGAGVALAMACDLRIAGEEARFAITPAKLGISYPQEDVARLVALVGPGQAARLLLSGQAIDAGEAARIGVVEIGPCAHPEAELGLVAEAVLANSGASLAILKQAIRLAEAGRASDPAQEESFDRLFASDELRRRLAALRGGA